MGLWQLPRDAYRGGRLKLSRQQYASQTMELIGETSIEDYDLENVAQNYGPGAYYLLLSAHPTQLWKAHNCKVTVAPEYAQAAGHQTYSQVPAQRMPRLADVQALNTTAAALSSDAPLTMANLMILMEAVVERTVKAQAQAQPVLGGVDSMMALWTTLNQMQSQTRQETMAMVKMLQTGKTEDEPENEWAAIGSGIALALPSILEAFRPKSAHPPPAPSRIDNEPSPQEDPMRTVVACLTQTEVDSFAASVAMLKPFVPQILMMIERSPDDFAIAADLAEWVPRPLEANLLRLAAMVADRGFEVMGIISQGLQTPRGAAIMAQLAQRLNH